MIRIYFLLSIIFLNSCTIENTETVVSEGNYTYFEGTTIQIQENWGTYSKYICNSLVECDCEYKSQSGGPISINVILGNNVVTPVDIKLYVDENLHSTYQHSSAGTVNDITGSYIYLNSGQKKSLKIYFTDSNSRTVIAECKDGNQGEIMTYISY